MRASVLVVGAGPAGLIAAEILATRGAAVTVVDAMPAAGRKFLIAGHSGLNLTNDEPHDAFAARYGARSAFFAAALRRFSPADLRAWAAGLGEETYVGTSGRVFPREMKGARLLKAWLDRLRGQGIEFRYRTRWTGLAEGGVRLHGPDGEGIVRPQATVLALGGGSWPQTGSDAGWIPALSAAGVAITPLVPANCGIAIAWSPRLIADHEGQPLKTIELSCGEAHARGEAVITSYGLEGGPVYVLGPALRAALARGGPATLHLDLKPDLTAEHIAAILSTRGKRSLSTVARTRLRLSPTAWALVRDSGGGGGDVHPPDPATIAQRIKRLALPVLGLRPLAEAISTAGGIAFSEVDDHLMLRRLPGTFVAGEMLDWEAPTGGYLLQGCFTTGWLAGQGAAQWLGPPL